MSHDTASPHRASAAPYVWRNLVIWILLVALIALSCGLAFVPLGPFNFPVALGIAAVQVACIAIFSMGLRHANALVYSLLVFAAIFIIVMFALTSADVVTRFANHWTR